MTSGRAASVVNHKELYFSSHIKMLDLYDDLPHQYNIHKIIYDDTSTLNDLITILKTNEKPINIPTKLYDYNKPLAALVDDEDKGRPSGPSPKDSEPRQGATMGARILNLDKQVRVNPNPLSTESETVERVPVHDDVCVDTGATEDVLGKVRGGEAINKQDSDDILIGMGGKVQINKVGDYVFAGELKTEQGLINDKSYMTCISVPDRTDKDWLFWADKDSAQLINPDNDKFDFTKDNGLYKLNKDQTKHKTIPNRLISKTDPDVDYLTQAWVSKSKDKKHIKREKLSGKQWIMMMMFSYMMGMPGLMSVPGLYDMMSDTKDKADIITDTGNKPIPAKVKTDTLYEHACKGHPHDPLCPACVRSRLTAKPNTKNDNDMIIKGSDKGAVIGIDYIGPYIKDVDGNVLAMTGVEVGSTNYGMIRLTKDREAKTSLKCYQEMSNEYKRLSKDDEDIVRVHHDQDKSFEGVCEQEWRKSNITNTNTGGYNPQANSRVERRHRSIKEIFKACMFMATGGLPYYYSLWGPGIVYAMKMNNINDDSSGRNYYETLTGQRYKYNIGKDDLAFGQQIYYHRDPEQMSDKWDTPGDEGIWVGRSDEVSGGHIIVPIEWDPNTNIYILGATVHVNAVRYNTIRFPLKMGPTSNSTAEQIDEVSMNEFIDDFFKPWYKSAEGDETEQVEGEDPILEVEKIISHSGRGSKTKYLTKWKGSDIKTYEPAVNFKHGGKDMLEQYRLSLKKGKKKANIAYCNISDRNVLRFDRDEDIVKHLIAKQNKKGDVNDWIKPYQEEFMQVKNRRLEPITDLDMIKQIQVDALPLRMILETKRDGRLKARLVAIGFKEPRHWDITSNSSPVVAINTIRAFLFMAGLTTDVYSSIDISVAFLQSNPYDEDAPKRYVVYKPHRYAAPRYYQLKGSIYGQRSASRQWFDTLAGWLEEKGYKQQEDEPCAFINDKGFKVLTYVDDLICRGSQEETDRFYILLGKRFDCKDYTILSPDNKLAFLGFDITCNYMNTADIKDKWTDGMIQNIQVDDKGNFMMIHMDQSDIIQTYLNTQEYNPILNISSPMGNKYHLLSEPEPLQGDDTNTFQSMVGTLNYIAGTTRYDISYPVARLAQFAANPTVGSIKAARKVLSYLAATQDFKISGIMLPKQDSLEYYSDSDHAGDMPITTYSHTGTVIMLNKVPIHWRSKKQPKTSRSSAEAEIYALSDTLADARLNNWRLIEEVGAMRFKKWDRGAMRGAPPGRHRTDRLGLLTPGLRTTPGNALGDFPVSTPPTRTGHSRTAMEKTRVST